MDENRTIEDVIKTAFNSGADVKLTIADGQVVTVNGKQVCPTGDPVRNLKVEKIIAVMSDGTYREYYGRIELKEWWERPYDGLNLDVEGENLKLRTATNITQLGISKIT